jgi:hypothetical protein
MHPSPSLDPHFPRVLESRTAARPDPHPGPGVRHLGREQADTSERGLLSCARGTARFRGRAGIPAAAENQWVFFRAPNMPQRSHNRRTVQSCACHSTRAVLRCASGAHRGADAVTRNGTCTGCSTRLASCQEVRTLAQRPRLMASLGTASATATAHLHNAIVHSRHSAPGYGPHQLMQHRTNEHTSLVFSAWGCGDFRGFHMVLTYTTTTDYGITVRDGTGTYH